MTTKSIDKKIQILPGPESTAKTEAANRLRLADNFRRDFQIFRNEANHRVRLIQKLQKPSDGKSRAIFARLCRRQIAIIRLQVREKALQVKYHLDELQLLTAFPGDRQIILPHRAQIEAGISQKTRRLLGFSPKPPIQKTASDTPQQHLERLLREARTGVLNQVFVRSLPLLAEVEQATSCAASS